MAWQSKTFTAAVTATDFSAYTPIQLSKTSAEKGGMQVARVFATGPSASGSTACTVRFALVKGGDVIYYEDATITPSSVASGSGDGKVGTVVFSGSSNNKLDLLGIKPSNAGGGNRRFDSYRASEQGAAVWMFAPITSGLGSWDDSLTLEIAMSGVI